MSSPWGRPIHSASFFSRRLHPPKGLSALSWNNWLFGVWQLRQMSPGEAGPAGTMLDQSCNHICAYPADQRAPMLPFNCGSLLSWSVDRGQNQSSRQLVIQPPSGKLAAKLRAAAWPIVVLSLMTVDVLRNLAAGSSPLWPSTTITCHHTILFL